jgi:hypothetical protein
MKPAKFRRFLQSLATFFRHLSDNKLTIISRQD